MTVQTTIVDFSANLKFHAVQRIRVEQKSAPVFLSAIWIQIRKSIKIWVYVCTSYSWKAEIPLTKNLGLCIYFREWAHFLNCNTMAIDLCACIYFWLFHWFDQIADINVVCCGRHAFSFEYTSQHTTQSNNKYNALTQWHTEKCNSHRRLLINHRLIESINGILLFIYPTPEVSSQSIFVRKPSSCFVVRHNETAYTVGIWFVLCLSTLNCMHSKELRRERDCNSIKYLEESWTISKEILNIFIILRHNFFLVAVLLFLWGHFFLLKWIYVE